MLSCIVLYSTDKWICARKTNARKSSLLQGTIADLNNDLSNEQFETIIRDPIQYMLPFVLMVFLTIGWIADVIVFCVLKSKKCAECTAECAEESAVVCADECTAECEMSFTEHIHYLAILISLLGIGTLIGIFVLVNLTRQRQSVSFSNGEPVR